MSMRDEFEKAFKKTYMDDNLNDFDRALWAAAWIVNHVHDHLCDMEDYSEVEVRFFGECFEHDYSFEEVTNEFKIAG